MDVWSLDMVPYLDAYLHASFQIEVLLAGSGIAGQDALAASPANGLTIGWLGALEDADQVFLDGGLSFNPIRLAFIGGTEPSTSVLVTRVSPNCPYTTFESLIRASHTSAPTMILPTAGAGALDPATINVAFALNEKNLTGYISTAAEIQGFVRGDGCLLMAPLSETGPLIQQGQARALTYLGKVVPGLGYGNTVKGVPTVAQLVSKYGRSFKTANERKAQQALLAFGPASGQVVAAPGATPVPELTALRAAMQWVERQPGFRSQALSGGLVAGYVAGPVAKQNFTAAFGDVKALVPELS